MRHLLNFALWMGMGLFIMDAVSQPLVIAHRGNSSAAPENTLAAVDSALKLGPPPQYVEIDIHRSLDNELVVSHDEDTFRATGVRGLIREQPYEALKQLNAGYKTVFGDLFKDERLPTLTQVLDAVEKTSAGVMIECKQLLLEEEVIALLKRRGELQRHIIASFDELTVYRAKQLEPQVTTLYLVDAITPGILWRAKDLKADIIGVAYKAGPETVALAHDKGFKVWVWTVDEPETIQQWAQAGVDGIISNEPAMVFQTLPRDK